MTKVKTSVYECIQTMQLYVKQLSGEILSLEFENVPTGDQLYRRVWEKLPEVFSPTKLWITNGEEWVEPRTDREAEVGDGDVLNLFICNNAILLKKKDEGVYGPFHKFGVRVDTLLDGKEVSQVVYVYFRDTGFYFVEDLDVDPDKGYVPYDDCYPKLTLEELVDKFQVSLCDREWLYASLYREFGDRVPIGKQVWPIYTDEECYCEECCEAEGMKV